MEPNSKSDIGATIQFCTLWEPDSKSDIDAISVSPVLYGSLIVSHLRDSECVSLFVTWTLQCQQFCSLIPLWVKLADQIFAVLNSIWSASCAQGAFHKQLRSILSLIANAKSLCKSNLRLIVTLYETGPCTRISTNIALIFFETAVLSAKLLMALICY